MLFMFVVLFLGSYVADPMSVDCLFVKVCVADLEFFVGALWDVATEIALRLCRPDRVISGLQGVGHRILSDTMRRSASMKQTCLSPVSRLLQFGDACI